VAKLSECEKGYRRWISPSNKPPKPTIDEMRQKLLDAGWKKYRNHDTAWVDPNGRIFRGPAKAYEIMNETFRPWPKNP